jgi:hypothetical protein
MMNYQGGMQELQRYYKAGAHKFPVTGFPWFPCVYKQMLRWFPSFQVATTCFSCSLPQLNFLVTYLTFYV